ncbi:MAG TPA: hypothetical protein VMV69_15665 [Pirellulales bacterium]|nr:hypothetical protein [Pirellulales bacterium]
MTDSHPSEQIKPPAKAQARAEKKLPASIKLVPYPKIVFLYPAWLTSLAAAIYLSFGKHPLDPDDTSAVVPTLVFLGILAVNLVVLGVDFPRTTSLTLFFFAAAVVMGLILIGEYHPAVLGAIGDLLKKFRPLASAQFYWAFFCILGAIYALVWIVVHFDYWEVRPNELLHHHGVLSGLERFSAPHMTIEKEITDVFEYLLLKSGRLILQPSNERPIVLDNVLFIERKEIAITRMLGALQVQVRQESTPGG